MRSRTELVTTQLEGSDFEDESDFEDSEEDWQPSKGEQKPKKIKSSSRGRKSTSDSKNGKKPRSRKPNKTSKRSSENDATSEVESVPIKKSRKMSNKHSATNLSNIGQTGLPVSQAETSGLEATTSIISTEISVKHQPLQRKIVTPLKSFPDKCGYLNLYIFKGDLKNGIVNNSQVCLWRRDGSSLLQKYLRDKIILSNVPQFNSSMVYSCWEDRRADEYLEVKVRCLEQSKQIRVELTNVDELEAKSKEEYEKYVATYGSPVPRSNKTREVNSSNDAADDGAECDDDDEDDDDDDEDVVDAGDDGELEYEDDEVEVGEIIPKEE